HLSAAALAGERGMVAEALRIADSAQSVVLAERQILRGLQARATAALFLYGRAEARPEVLDALRECRPALGELGDPVTSGRCAAALAHVALEDGDLAGARELAETSLGSLAGADTTLTEARTRLVLGTILAEDGDKEGARREASAAAALLRTVPDGRETADAWRQAGELMERTGNAEGALEALRRALGAVGIGGV
ncbi:hypothetical protein, partial [Streptomyces sp. 8N706]|uniref:hypothetical protein n=1 Tax=Streptomyces sp. 8N706 TaxID=3457416 RepID=UPI003FD0BF7A